MEFTNVVIVVGIIYWCISGGCLFVWRKRFKTSIKNILEMSEACNRVHQTQYTDVVKETDNIIKQTNWFWCLGFSSGVMSVPVAMCLAYLLIEAIAK